VDRRIAAFAFLIVCVVLAALLLVHATTPVIASAAFAIALAILGGASAGFRKRRPQP
jgi:hypothetical protein